MAAINSVKAELVGGLEGGGCAMELELELAVERRALVGA